LRDEQSQGMQRLSQIVASRHKARSGMVGEFKLTGALFHLAFKRYDCSRFHSTTPNA